jgi:two-component system, NtrC family, response regulator GlrR
VNEPPTADEDAKPAGTEALGGVARDHLLFQRFVLRVEEGPDAGLVYESSGDGVVVGTHASCGFVLTDSAVSRFHCEIGAGSGAPLIRDLGSRNGTRVDGVSVLAAPLGERERYNLSMGRSRLALEWGERDVKVPLSSRTRFGLLAAQSASMRRAFSMLESAAQSDVTVLLGGETGTGKDLAAESIHLASARRDAPFVVVDCGSIVESLLDAELFGHEKGAFTGADRAREGAFEAARGGTLFIDEIGELPLSLQPKFLRVIERREVQRLGSNQRLPVDVRLIAATHRDLRSDINNRRFRSDLFFRLAVIEVKLPSLRQRLDDLPLLVDSLLDNLEVTDPAMRSRLRAQPFLDELSRHDWPGNVRELKNFLERWVALEGRVSLTDEKLQPAAFADGLAFDIGKPLRGERERWLLHFEQQFLKALLAHHRDNVTEAAKAAGVARVHFYRLLHRCGLR